MSMTTETQQQQLHNAHEHLRHDATSDAPEVVRERNRRLELAGQRQTASQAKSTDNDKFQDS